MELILALYRNGEGHKYAGMEVSDLKRLKELESENAILNKQMYADLALQNTMLKDVLGKSGKAF